MKWDYVDTGKWVSDCQQYRIKILSDGRFDLSYGGYDDNDVWVDIELLGSWLALEIARGRAGQHNNKIRQKELALIREEIFKQAKGSDPQSVGAAAAEMILELREAQRQT